MLHYNHLKVSFQKSQVCSYLEVELIFNAKRKKKNPNNGEIKDGETILVGRIKGTMDGEEIKAIKDGAIKVIKAGEIKVIKVGEIKVIKDGEEIKVMDGRIMDGKIKEIIWVFNIIKVFGEITFKEMTGLKNKEKRMNITFSSLVNKN